MTEREQAKAALQRAHNELEKRVEERTAELRLANEQLRLEMSERHVVDEQLAAEKERLSVTLRSIGDGVITTDMTGKILLLNKAAEEFTGWRQNEALEAGIEKVYNIEMDPRHSRLPANTVERILGKPGAPIDFHPVLICRDGTRRIVAENGAPILDKTGATIGVVLVFRDITETQKLEDELFKARKLESLSLLSAGIAHDFNNILTCIITNLFMAKMNIEPTSEACQLIVTAEKAACRASSLTNQLLTFARTGTPVKQNSSIKELIEDSVGFYLSGSKSDYRLELPDNLYNVEIDRGQIDQVLNNIILNADQAMPEGGLIVVKAENYSVDGSRISPLQEGNYIRISVSDQGMGIPHENLSKIFDPYFTTRENGNGLGLTTSYAIIQRHGGNIEVNSRVDVGTTFSVFYLPGRLSILPPVKLSKKRKFVLEKEKS